MKRVFVLMALAAIMASTGFASAHDEMYGRPARPPFSMVAVRVHHITSEGLARNSWAWIELNGKVRLAFVDLRGQVIEHAVSARHACCVPTVRVEGGSLFVESAGKTYKFAPNGRVENRAALGIVSKTIDGPLGTAKLYLPAIVNSPQYVETTQWVEVLHVPRPAVPQEQPPVPRLAPPMVPPEEAAPGISPRRQSHTDEPKKEGTPKPTGRGRSVVA